MIASTLSPNLARWLITNILRQVRGVRLRPLALIFTITLGLVAFARAGTFSFEPTDDAYLEGTTPFNDEFLRVATGSQVSYLKFTVSGLTGTIETATLRLQESDDAGSGTLRVFRGSHNSWTETTLSSDDAPVQDGELGSFTGTISNNEIVNVEITSLITGDGTYSVIISQDTGGNDVAFGSSESTTSPVLIVETSDAPTYSLTVVNGSGDGTYAAGTSVNIAAAPPPAGQEFDQWTGDLDGVVDVDDPSTSITMPAADATLIATYKDLLYTLTVVSGSGGGNYTAGTSVNITANPPPAGQEFDQWTGDLDGVVDVDDPTTSLTMPAANATLSATYRDRLYTLTVVNGSGGGNYAAGASINITADPPPAGQEFHQWIGDLDGVVDVDDPSTSVTMPATNATLIATYKDLLYTLAVVNGTGDGTYAAGTSSISPPTPHPRARSLISGRAISTASSTSTIPRLPSPCPPPILP